jgi:hypothetical protein
MVPFLQVCDMERVACSWHRLGLGQACQDLPSPFWGEYRLSEALDVVAEAMGEHVAWHGGFDLTVTDEEDHGMDDVVWNSEKLGHGPDVAVVLTERILKPGLLPVDALSPVRRVLVSENPPLHVFRLNHEDSVDGDKHMVDLGGAPLAGEHKVVDPSVNFAVETHPHPELGCLFAEPTFEDSEHA